ncbi:uncharacterized protein LOC128093413 [Culex pipiens pallens]|uniref:uncharacterized protein LOC128093413 n=1 Tax=Culex pipiens pallens TaxID=42434 RepID=UPI0022AA7CC5|nr:uncharacterized protein LOC128093413 [Culex pipiens pallens]
MRRNWPTCRMQPSRKMSTRTPKLRSKFSQYHTVLEIGPWYQRKRTVANCPDVTRNIAFKLHTCRPRQSRPVYYDLLRITCQLSRHLSLELTEQRDFNGLDGHRKLLVYEH